MKKFILILMVAFATLSFTSSEDFTPSDVDSPDCSTVFTVCNLAHPDNYPLFEQCMVNNGCGDGGVIIIKPKD